MAKWLEIALYLLFVAKSWGSFLGCLEILREARRSMKVLTRMCVSFLMLQEDCIIKRRVG